MSQEQEREDRAFEALVVEVLRRLDEDVCIEANRAPNEEEFAALHLLGPGFISRLVHGQLEPKPAELETRGVEPAMAGDGSSWELFRCEGVDDAIQDELKKADEEIIKRKQGKEDGEAS